MKKTIIRMKIRKLQNELAKAKNLEDALNAQFELATLYAQLLDDAETLAAGKLEMANLEMKGAR